MLDQTRIDELAAIGRSGAQQEAIRKALSQLAEDQTVLDTEAPKPGLVTAQSDMVVFVLSGEGVTDEDRRSMYSALDYIADQTSGPVHVCTVGRMGVELDAVKWASRHDAILSEFGAVWAIPNADGTTKRNPNARNPRNRKLREFCEQAVRDGKRVVVLAYGTERSNDRVEPLLVRAGAWPRKTSSLYDERKHSATPPRPDVPPVVEPQDDPGAVAAGAPDIEPQPA